MVELVGRCVFFFAQSARRFFSSYLGVFPFRELPSFSLSKEALPDLPHEIFSVYTSGLPRFGKANKKLLRVGALASARSNGHGREKE